MIDYVKAHGRLVFDGVSTLIRGSVDGLTSLLRIIPAPLLILGRSGPELVAATLAAAGTVRHRWRCCSS